MAQNQHPISTKLCNNIEVAYVLMHVFDWRYNWKSEVTQSEFRELGLNGDKFSFVN